MMVNNSTNIKQNNCNMLKDHPHHI